MARGARRNASWKLRQIAAPSSAPSVGSSAPSLGTSTTASTVAASTNPTTTFSSQADVRVGSAGSGQELQLVVPASQVEIAPVSPNPTTNSSVPDVASPGSGSSDPAKSSAVATSQSANAPISPPTFKQATKIPKQSSKTAIGRVTYGVEQAPNFFVVESLVENETGTRGGTWEPVRSSRLRKLAVDHRLGQEHAVDIKHLTSVDTRGLGTAYVIARFQNLEQHDNIRDRLRRTSKTVVGVTEKDKENDVMVDRAIRCKIETEAASASCEISLKTKLSHLPGGEACFTDFPDMQNVPRAIDPRLPGCERLSSPTKPAYYLLHIRCEPAVDDDDKNLHFDFDVVACLPEKSLHDFLLDLVGQKGATNLDQGVISEHLPAVTRTLRGVQVRCAYFPGQKYAAGQAKAEILSSEDMPRGRRFRIKDIKMPEHVPTFTAGDTEYAVYAYFKNGKALIESLPLVQDDSGAWIPLEMLVVDRHQVLRRFGHKNEIIRNAVRAFTQRGGVTAVRQYAQDRCDELALVVYGQDPENPEDSGQPQRWLKFSSKPEVTLNPDLFPPSKPRTLEKDEERPARLRYLYILPGGGNVNDEDLPNKVINGFEGVSYTIDKNESMESELVANAPPNDPESDFIFALIYDRGRSKAEIQKPMARMHKFGALTAGAPVVCIVRSHPKKLYDSRLEASESHLLDNLQAKMNYMLGGRNFDTKLGTVTAGQNIMIAAAHIAHRVGEQPYCPSITALVATASPSSSQYLGSTRLQATTAAEQADGKVRRGCIPRIICLRDMFIERFKTWSTAPAKLLFFRDSITFYEATFNEECNQIQDAFKLAFPAASMPLALAYVVANKNTEITYQTTNTEQAVTPHFDYLAHCDAIAKYRYYVIRNNIGYSAQELASLTQHINESSQLTHQAEQVAKALPLTCAGKLCERVHDLFRLDDGVLGHIECVKGPDEAMIDREAVEEERAVEGVNKWLGVGEARFLPWEEALDLKMFYL